jgi:hypothetical protein
MMEINRMLEELRAEREQIEEAIVVLQRLAAGQGKRRGRPPKWMSEVAEKYSTENDFNRGHKIQDILHSNQAAFNTELSVLSTRNGGS